MLLIQKTTCASIGLQLAEILSFCRILQNSAEIRRMGQYMQHHRHKQHVYMSYFTVTSMVYIQLVPLSTGGTCPYQWCRKQIRDISRAYRHPINMLTPKVRPTGGLRHTRWAEWILPLYLHVVWTYIYCRANVYTLQSLLALSSLVMRYSLETEPQLKSLKVIIPRGHCLRPQGRVRRPR
jgi:hypothetical protein